MDTNQGQLHGCIPVRLWLMQSLFEQKNLMRRRLADFGKIITIMTKILLQQLTNTL
jgi:hypothetical protein